MTVKLDLITIVSSNVKIMQDFYQDILNLEVVNEQNGYVEFNCENIRFAICERGILGKYHPNFFKSEQAYRFELAFKCINRKELDQQLELINLSSGRKLTTPQMMPWGYYTALFTDPDGNIHELFCK